MCVFGLSAPCDLKKSLSGVTTSLYTHGPASVTLNIVLGS